MNGDVVRGYLLRMR